jgi:hypothetical protein
LRIIAKVYFIKTQSGAVYRPGSRLTIVPVPQPPVATDWTPPMSQQPTSLTAPRWKLGARATPYVFAFFMASIMAMLMCLVITAANAGINADYPARVLGAYQLAMPTAFCCVLAVRPLVVRLVALTVHPAR